MKKTYHVVYKSSTDGDCCTVWTKADSRENAISHILNEYWDVKEIIDVY